MCKPSSLEIFYPIFCCLTFICFPPAEPEAHCRGAETGEDSHPILWLRGGVRRPGLRQAGR